MLSPWRRSPVLSNELEKAFEELWPHILDDIDMQSSPGLSALARFGATNGEVLKYDIYRNTFDPNRVSMLKSLVLNRLYAVLNAKPADLVDPHEAGVCDPIKLFIKPEPHKDEKVKTGRLRLISSVSLIDSCVDRFLFLRTTYKVLSVVYEYKTPVMIGWTPLKGGYTQIYRGWEKVKKFVCIDKSAWDWSLPYWLIEAMMEVLISISDDAPVWWIQAVETRFHLLFKNPQFAFSDFGKVRQGVSGIMKSGCYLTILLNSIGQLMLHVLACLHLNQSEAIHEFMPKVLGDDSVQPEFPFVDEYVDYLTELGFVCKVEKLDHIDFAGFVYKDNKFYPAYPSKHLFKLRYLPVDEYLAKSTLMNFQVLYTFDADFLSMLQEIARTCGHMDAIVDKRRLLAITNGTK